MVHRLPPILWGSTIFGPSCRFLKEERGGKQSPFYRFGHTYRGIFSSWGNFTVKSIILPKFSERGNFMNCVCSMVFTINFWVSTFFRHPMKLLQSEIDLSIISNYISSENIKGLIIMWKSNKHTVYFGVFFFQKKRKSSALRTFLH